MNWCTSSGRSSLCLLSESMWMSHGHAMRPWLVFLFVPYCLRGLCAFSLSPVLVHYSQRDVSLDFVPLHQLGKFTREMRRGFRGRTRISAGPSSHLG